MRAWVEEKWAKEAKESVTKWSIVCRCFLSTGYDETVSPANSSAFWFSITPALSEYVHEHDVAAQLIILPQPLHCRARDTNAPSPNPVAPLSLYKHTWAHWPPKKPKHWRNALRFNTLSALAQRFINSLRCAYQYSDIKFRGDGDDLHCLSHALLALSVLMAPTAPSI